MANIGAWWLASRPALAGEQVVTRWLANRAQNGRAVGGALFLTTRRLVFCPHRLDQLTGGQGWDVPLGEVATVDVAPRTGHPFDGGLRDRLRVRSARGAQELFVLNRLPHVVDAVRARLPRAQ
ncbi:hypothetical protein [Actinomycetospora aeridis]|uniref:GRAM domain-containing protein n=1 Tax=Actinomycetospora aeridis TaxID=3129231 RepID=A0ABU8MZZ9_9PSEU